MNCPQCRAVLIDGAVFCSQCGTRVANTAPSMERAREERRQISVLFCDLVGSTELSNVLDPDDMSHVLQAYHNVADSVIIDYRGHVAQHLGDGILVYFGYPNVEEDDPVRAVAASLRLIEAMPQLQKRLQQEIPELAGRALNIRIAIDMNRGCGADGADGRRRAARCWRCGQSRGAPAVAGGARRSDRFGFLCAVD